MLYLTFLLERDRRRHVDSNNFPSLQSAHGKQRAPASFHTRAWLVRSAHRHWHCKLMKIVFDYNLLKLMW